MSVIRERLYAHPVYWVGGWVGPRARMRTVKRRRRLPALALLTIVTELSGFPVQAQGL